MKGLIDRLRSGYPSKERMEAANAIEHLIAELEQLKLGEEGAKEAFGHVVEQKQDVEKRIKEITGTISAQQDVIFGLTKELEQCRKDAERYRWLRDSDNQMHEDDISVSDSSFSVYFENDLDVAVDAGIERGKGLPDLGAKRKEQP